MIPAAPREVVWSYGVTTVPSRRNELLPRTLASLRGAGFDRPRLFVDGGYDSFSWEEEFGVGVTMRGGDPVRTFGNWLAALVELYCRSPQADRYAIFQDDFVTYRGLREYLDTCKYPGEILWEDIKDGKSRPRYEKRPDPMPRIANRPGKGYWNLYTMPSNDHVARRDLPPGFKGWFPSNQFGRGAVALVFNREAVIELLGSPHMADRPVHSDRGWKAVDGGIVTAMAKVGYREYCHTPSLVQHTGGQSSMGNNSQPLAPSFLGERYDAKLMIGKTGKVSTGA